MMYIHTYYILAFYQYFIWYVGMIKLFPVSGWVMSLYGKGVNAFSLTKKNCFLQARKLILPTSVHRSRTYILVLIYLPYYLLFVVCDNNLLDVATKIFYELFLIFCKKSIFIGLEGFKPSLKSSLITKKKWNFCCTF